MNMKKTIITILALPAFLSPIAYLHAKSTLPGENLPILSDLEEENIIHLREEEKLARDVYLIMYDVWGQKIYLNISDSEQRHMDAVKQLIDKYGLEDPVVDDSSCVFTNQDFAKLCEELVTKGELSLEDGYEAGVIIEEMDIEDIQRMIGDTDKPDILKVLGSLLEGSVNHLEAFEKNLDSL